MQAVQPEIQKVQAKYKGKTDQVSRQKMVEETQALYKKHGTSPFSSCLPLLVQMPILFAMYRAIYAVKDIAEGRYTYRGEAAESLGPITKSVAEEIDGSTVMGVPLSQTIRETSSVLGIGTFIVLIIVMVGLQFLSMYMMMKRNMPPSADPNNPMVRSQKMMMYMMPAMFIFSGFFFQMGLLIYMVTTTLWAWGQQIWTLKFMPTPGSPAYLELVKKRQDRYQSWAKDYFVQYETKRTSLSDATAIDEFNADSLVEVQERAKSARIASDFPAELSDGEVLTIYRNLATQEWTTLPDELWMRGVKRQTEKNLERRAQQEARQQPKHQSRRQRQEQKRAQRGESSSQDHGLTPEEIERRRQARRKARRQSGKKKKK
ncbi:MAG: hypothetical protein CSA82_00925 [Actinobacteria bacterium]|nr:MAG: hypothetical protein CSA82_00925 [Actinomycetota bacterium]